MSVGEKKGSEIDVGDPLDFAEDDVLLLIRMGATPKRTYIYSLADLREYLAVPGTDNDVTLGTALKRWSDVRAALAHIDGQTTVASGVVTVDTPLLLLTQTWNGAAVEFHAIDLNVTDTASDPASALVRLRVGGVDKFTVTKGGVVTATEFEGDFTGDLTGDVLGNVTGNLTGNVTGNVTGNLTGDVTGNVTGDVTGDVSGSAGSVAADALTGTTLAAGVTQSSLTGLGTLTRLTLGPLAVGMGTIDGSGVLTVVDPTVSAKTRIVATYASSAPGAILYWSGTAGVGFTITGTPGQSVTWLRVETP